MPDGIDGILAERKKTHGNYDDDARCAMRLLDVLADEEARRGERLTAVQRHSLGMILHKVARIVTGQADFKDHWDDIAGYARLVADRCERDRKLDAEALTQTFGPQENYRVTQPQLIPLRSIRGTDDRAIASPGPTTAPPFPGERAAIRVGWEDPGDCDP